MPSYVILLFKSTNIFYFTIKDDQRSFCRLSVIDTFLYNKNKNIISIILCVSILKYMKLLSHLNIIFFLIRLS